MKTKKNRKNPVAAICSALGTLLLIIIVVACLPLTVPKVFGYEMYTVISGSMEPSIPTGSLVYIKDMEPQDVADGDVIAFYGGHDSNAIITHRVVKNRVVMGEFVTKGDANEKEDMNPIPYMNFLGRVELSIPVVGELAQMLTSMEGKIAAGTLIGVAVILQLLASLLDRRRD